MQNAREFLNEIAAALRAKGRIVEITETEESFGTFVWLSSPPQAWYERSISLSARKSNTSGRWALGPLNVGSSGSGTKAGKSFKEELRWKIAIAVDVYA